MGGNKYFQFKRFKIIQEKSAMKVGTDGILLGAWGNGTTAKTILDVGTGTGLLALMLAQRTKAQITGLEIEKKAAREAAYNVQISPWANRINIENISFQDFYMTTNKRFDVIITNPPFFENSLMPDKNERAFARHNISLTHSELIFGASQLITENGKFICILPAHSFKRFVSEALSLNLFPRKICDVKFSPKKPLSRILLELGKTKTVPQKDCLNIYDETGKNYSSQFKDLTREFYLKF